MKVLLVQPYSLPASFAGDEASLPEPLALEYVGASVKDICETHLIDLRLEPDLDKLLKSYQPDVVGLTGYSVHVNVVRRLAEQVRAHDPATKIVIGGCHAVAAPHDYLPAKPDFIVSGQGIWTFRSVLEDLQGTRPIEQAENINVATEGPTRIITQKSLVPLSEFPLPDRTLTKRYRKDYRLYWWKPVAAVRTSAGCRFRCSFCSLWHTYRGKYFTRDPQSIYEEIASLDAPYVIFFDDETLLEPKVMRELAELLRKNNIKKKYRMMIRTDSIIKNKDLLRLWQEIGLRQVFVGVEAMDDKGLKRVNKGTSVKTNEEAMAFLREIGVTVISDFIIHQDFTKDDFRALREYVKRLKLPSAIFTIMMPLPGTKFYHEVEDQMIDKQFEHYDVMHTLLPTHLPIREFYEEVYNLYRASGTLRERLRFMSQFSPLELWRLMRIYRKTAAKMKQFFLEQAVESS